MNLKERVRSNVFVRVALAVFIVFCIVSIVKIQLEFNELKDKKAALNEQKEDYVFSIDKIQNDLNTPVDDDYIIRVAKEKLNLRLPEEIIFYNDLAN